MTKEQSTAGIALFALGCGLIVGFVIGTEYQQHEHFEFRSMGRARLLSVDKWGNADYVAEFEKGIQPGTTSILISIAGAPAIGAVHVMPVLPTSRNP